MMKHERIVLASASPRRRELLANAGYQFDIVVSDADETVPPGLAPEQAAQHTARAKALAVAQGVDGRALVIGADTMVVLDGRIFGKPHSEEQARSMLRELSGRAHEVITGVCLAAAPLEPNAAPTRADSGPCDSLPAIETFAVTTLVQFRVLSEEEISAYVATGEPMDKAGAYGIQGKGGALVDHIEGDYDNVVGLPVAALCAQLGARGINPCTQG